jgi:hypothetical protein
VKVPAWMSSTILSASAGTEIGYSYPIDISADRAIGERTDTRLVVVDGFGNDSKSHAREYGVSVPAASHNLHVFETHGSGTICEGVASTLHLLPKRDQVYSTLLKERLANAGSHTQHRTLHNEQGYVESRGSVKLFQRPSESDHITERIAGSPDSGSSSVRGSKRLRSLDELPQREKQQSAPPQSNKTVDDVIMEILVKTDSGWPLMQLSKAVKEAGATVSTVQLKAKLLDICVYQRRGEDSHPRYYLKNEYK